MFSLENHSEYMLISCDLVPNVAFLKWMVTLSPTPLCKEEQMPGGSVQQGTASWDVHKSIFFF